MDKTIINYIINELKKEGSLNYKTLLFGAPKIIEPQEFEEEINNLENKRKVIREGDLIVLAK